MDAVCFSYFLLFVSKYDSKLSISIAYQFINNILIYDYVSGSIFINAATHSYVNTKFSVYLNFLLGSFPSNKLSYMPPVNI